MLFEKQNPLNVLVCPNCKAVGFKTWQKCSACRGMAMGHFRRGRWLYWGLPLTRYDLNLIKARNIFNKIRLVTLVLMLINIIIWFGWLGYKSGLGGVFINTPWLIFKNFTGSMWILLSFALAIIIYIWSLLVREHRHEDFVEHYNYDQKEVVSENPEWNNWSSALKISRHKRVDISNTYTPEAIAVITEAYNVADQSGAKEVVPVHLFYALLSFNRISNIFIRLGLPSNILQDKLGIIKKNSKERLDQRSTPIVAQDFRQILFQAYEEAYNAHQDYVSVTELLLSTVKQSPPLQEFLFELNIDRQKLINVVEWVRIRERLHRQYVKYSRNSARHSKQGMDKAMTAVQTPYLNQFSEDLTLLAQYGHLDPCEARDTEIEEIFRVVESGGKNVILVGDTGVGKRSIIEGIAKKMAGDDVPRRLYDKRLVRLSTSALLAGTTPSGAVERLMGIMHDIARARNVVLFIHNIHDLVGVTAGGNSGGGMDVATSLAEQLGRGTLMTFATTDTDAFGKFVANSPLSNVFTKVEVHEMNENQAIQVLESKVGYTEYKNSVFFSYDAIEKSVKLARKFVHETLLPGSALEVMNEAASYTHSTKGPNTLVSAEEVAKVVSQKARIPVTTVTADESTKLLNLENEMHKRVVGQEEAVDLVANALRRARAEIRSTSRPIANFLFMGPTGVGKTELAKTIAEVYFGGEDRMIRLDMSEYQDKNSIYRLIGAPGERGTGILTEKIRRNPFSLLLLDEMEKADKDILNLFLQVMDDGRLTDSTGHLVDFTNVILIATTNAGTQYVQEQMRAGLSSEAIKDRLMHGELNQYFRPEFLNRFDGVVLFKSLDRLAIKKIAGFMFKRVAKDLEAKGVELFVEEPALDYLADIGFDPEFGARPMRRAIQERIENKLAELVLSGKLKRRDKVIVGEGGKIEVESK